MLRTSQLFVLGSFIVITPCLADVGDREPTNLQLLLQTTGKATQQSLEPTAKLAEKGNAEAQYKLGEMYENADGVAHDYTKAAFWYRKAAEQGLADAQTNLALLYKNGLGIPQDYAQALVWDRKAVDQGHARAQNNLGMAYYEGKGVSQDYSQAVAWFRKAVEQGYAVAQFNLAHAYYHGRGVPQSYEHAVAWFRTAAAQGYAKAEFSLGRAYANGKGVPQDSAEALNWYRKAADQGYINAQNALGSAFAQGRGVQQDYTQAAVWYRKAAEQGDHSAREKLNSLPSLERSDALDTLKTKMAGSSIAGVDSKNQLIESRLKRERIIGRLEAQYGIEATKLYVKNMDYNAGGDKNIDANEAPDFAKNAIEGRLLWKMHEYDVNFPRGGTNPEPSLFPPIAVAVKPRTVYEKEWKEIICENDNPYTFVKREAKSLGFSISEESVNIGVNAACGQK